MRLYRVRQILGIATVVAIVLLVVLPFVLDAMLMAYEGAVALVVLALFAVELWLWRCPHCDTHLWHVPLWGFERYCPYCGRDMYDDSVEWYDDFAKLNYMHGELEAFENGGEDMLLVTYEDGMRIHVGYDSEEHEFVITVLENDTEEAKDTPLAVERVFGQNKLLEALQQAVHTWRDDKEI